VDRLDALLLVLKSCHGVTCVEPWNVLHPAGDVQNLFAALNVQYDAFYRNQVKVSYDRCELGYILDAEGSQVPWTYRDGVSWHHWV
jgi:N-acetylglucosamine-6-sulfatase